MKPRILILAGEPPESLGGMEHVIRELAKGLEQRGYTVEVLHRGNSSPGWIARPANKWQSYAADVLLGWYHGRKVQERMGEDVVAVLSNGFWGWCLPGIPSWVKKIHMYHGTYRGVSKAMQSFISFAGARKLRWWDSMVLERGSGRNKQIICNSDQTRDEVLKYFGYQGATVWLPLDTSHFRPLDREDARLRFSIPLEAKVGMFVGSTQPQKRVPRRSRIAGGLAGVEMGSGVARRSAERLKRHEECSCLQERFPSDSPLALQCCGLYDMSLLL